MKKIFLLICFCFLASRGIPGDVGGQLSPKETRCEDYLIIKYLIHLHAFEKAEVLVDRYLEKYPDDPFILTEKAWLDHKVRNNPEAALKHLKKSTALYPGYYYSNYLLASVLLTRYSQTAAGKPEDKEAVKTVEEALKYLEISTADNPDFHDGYFLKGIILSERGKYAESNRAFERASRLKETAESYDYMAYNYNRLNDSAGEIASYQKILELNPVSYRALHALARIHLEKEDFKQAALYLERLHSQNPDNQELSFEYLYSLFAAEETDKFMELTQTIDVSNSPLLTFARALILNHREKYDEAEQLLKKAKNLDSSSYILLAEIYIRKQDYYQAYQVIEKIAPPGEKPLYYSMRLQTLALLNMNQRIVKVFNLIRGNEPLLQNLTENDYYTVLFAYANLDQPDKVREVAQLAANRLKEKSKALTDLIQMLRDFSADKKINVSGSGSKLEFDRNIFIILTLYKNQHRYENAVFLLKELCGEAKDAGPCLELCDIYREQGHPELAEKMIKKLRKQFPDSLPVKNFYAYFLALQNKNLEHALKLSADTLADSSGSANPAYLDTYGYILLRLGRLPEATKYLEQAYQRHPFEQEIMEHLVDCYRQKKENKRIREIYQKAIDNGVDFKDQLIKKTGDLETKNKDNHDR